MLLYRYRTGIILCFAIAGVSMSATLLSARLKHSKVDPAQKYVVPARPAPLHLEGGPLNAVLLAYTDIVLDANIPPDHKELSNYSVDIEQDTFYYKLKFVNNQLPEDSKKDGTAVEIIYWISKETGRITRSR